MYRPKISRRQLIFHTLGLGLAWGFYFFGFFTVSISIPEIYRTVSKVLSTQAIVVLLITIAWIKYHHSLHKKKTPRKLITGRKWDYKEDWLGYKTSMNRAYIKKAKMVTIECNDKNKTKHYLLPKKDKSS